MQASSRVTINTGILYAKMAITVFISLYTTRLILDALGVTDYGIFNVVAGAVSMLTFMHAAMASATQRFMSYAQGEGKDEKKVQIFNASVVLHFLISILVVLLMEGVGYFLFNGILKIPAARMGIAQLIFQFAIVSTWFNILAVPYDAVINAHENMLFFAILDIIEKVLRLGIALYITYSPYGYDKLAAFGLLIGVISFVLLAIRHLYCTRYYDEVKFGVRHYYDRDLFKEMTRFAGWSFLGSSTSMVSHYGQGIVLNMFFGPVVNAAQGIAADLSGKLGAFSNTMRRALNPVIDKSEGAGDRNRMLKTSIMGGKMSFFLLAFFAVPVIIEMPFILRVWLNRIPNYAVIFARLILFLNLIRQLFLTLGSSISAVGNIRNFKIAESIANPISLVFSYIFFLYGYPPYWLYIMVILTALVDSAIILFYANKVTGLSVSSFMKNTVLRIIGCFTVTSIIALLPILFMKDGYLRLLVVNIISVGVLFFSMWIIGLEKAEKIVFSEMFHRFKNRGRSYITNI